MAVDDISGTNAVLAAVLINQGRSITQQTAPTLSNLLTTPPPTVAPDQDISTALQQSALQINAALEELGFTPPSATEALLLDETNPATALLLEETELNTVQQTVLAVNETLTGLAATSETQAGPPTPTPVSPSVPPTNAETGGVTTAIETSGTPLAAAAAASTQATSTPTAAPAETTTPIQQAIVQPVQDRNVIATPVYEIRDPKPPEPEPTPRRKEVFPSIPVGRARPVDPLVLRQEWERRKENRREEENAPRPALAERSIREMIGRANDDLTANGLPLRLVLAKNDDGYSVDVYDCSYDEECRLSQEVRLDLNQLVTILENLQHETGIIINIMT